MSPTLRFTDEWLVKLAVQRFGVSTDFIEHSRIKGERYLSSALVRASLTTPEKIGEAVTQEYGIPFVVPTADKIDQSAVDLVTEKLCRTHNLLPLGFDRSHVRVAMSNPLDTHAQGEVQFLTGRRVTPFYCHPDTLEPLIRKVLRVDTVISTLLTRIKQTEEIQFASPDAVVAKAEEAESRPIIQFVNAVISNAVLLRASDIHLEHGEESSTVRYRVDGLLRKMMVLPKFVGAGPVVARMKIIAGLDIAERRPQDGRATVIVGANRISLRVSTLPTGFGEKVVVRILDEKVAHRPLESLGFRPALLVQFRRFISRKQGILLVTGPTGSGKTSVLHSALMDLRSEDTNIVTVEDPVEYRLVGVNQVQVNEKQGLTFAAVLRSVLRQDPDIIMVGEIRDAETATIAFQAAQTGHLVMSTLHTNDSLSTVIRLTDMGVEPYKVAAALIGVTAQRLVRRLCSDCRQQLSPKEAASALQKASLLLDPKPKLFAPKGCSECDHTGYRGRVLLLELLEINRELRGRIHAGNQVADMRQAAFESKALHTMEEDILFHLSEGHTSLEEVVPYLKDLAATPIESEPQEPTARRSERKRILVAEPNGLLAATLRRLLEREGIEAEDYEDSEQALVSIGKNPPEAVMVRLAEPGFDGLKLVRLVRSEQGLADLPILGLTSGTDTETDEQLRKEDVTDIVQYPSDDQLVLARIRGVLKRRENWSATEAISVAPQPVDEAERCAALQASGLLDTAAEERYDTITRLAQRVFNVPMALVSLVDQDRQWFKSRQGIKATETPREHAFCAHAILQDDTLVVEDAAIDARFAQNPLVLEDQKIRFYAGHPILGPGGHKFGTLCILDRQPRQLSVEEKSHLRALARLVTMELQATTPSPKE